MSQMAFSAVSIYALAPLRAAPEKDILPSTEQVSQQVSLHSVLDSFVGGGMLQ